MWVKILIIPVLLLFALIDFSHAQTEYSYTPAAKDPSKITNVIGRIGMHTVQTGETLLDIARKYDMGISELTAFYPEKDPWLLEAGSEMQIPALWILPPSKRQGIVINVPEMRLYHFHPKKGSVSTYPVTVGEEETPTPLGTFRIVDREIDPEWNIPSKLQPKYSKKIMQAGDDNPIGKYWLGLSRRGYGIHGTDNAWSVGRILSNGCIRLYPEDIETLFPDVPKGTVVEIIYEPVKFGFRDRVIFVEVHEDPYGLIEDLEQHTRDVAQKMAIDDSVDWEKVYLAMDVKNGVPTPVGTLSRGDGAKKSSSRR
jgi:L,D-transpeptidase ErfK/SrfK